MPGYRLKNFARALFSGYVVLAANVAFTLLSIPLALHYLSGPEFGLWALTAQMAGYLALVDFGLSGAVSRLLIDYKDHKERPDYGGLVKTSFLVSVAQGLIVLALGALVVPLIRPGTELTPALVHDFRWLLFGQCVWMAMSFLSRNFTNLLWAHQRLDVGNYAQVVAFLVNFGVLWVSFAHGAGVFSLLWGQLVGWVVGTVIQVWACGWLHLFPRAGQWGQANWKQFREVFSYGKDVFFFALGSQMINASQTILITPCLGLQAAAVWAVCTRTYTLLCQVVWRIFDSAATPLSEMYVRNEHERLFRRFRGTTVLAGSAAVCAAVMFAVCNQPFVQVWSAGKMGWAVSNDVMLGVWSVLIAIQRCHVGFLGVVKDLRTVKYVYLAEGLVLVGLALLLTPKWGIAGLIAELDFCDGDLQFCVWTSEHEKPV